MKEITSWINSLFCYLKIPKKILSFFWVSPESALCHRLGRKFKSNGKGDREEILLSDFALKTVRSLTFGRIGCC